MAASTISQPVTSLTSTSGEARTVPLHQLPHGVCAVIVDVAEIVGCMTARRMRDLGFIPGATMRIVGRGSFRGPLAVEIAGSRFGLRRSETMRIKVRYLVP